MMPMPGCECQPLYPPGWPTTLWTWTSFNVWGWVLMLIRTAAVERTSAVVTNADGGVAQTKAAAVSVRIADSAMFFHKGILDMGLPSNRCRTDNACSVTQLPIPSAPPQPTIIPNTNTA